MHHYFRGIFTERDEVKMIKKILGENEVESVLQRLDRLTLDEARATAAQTLEVVHGLVQNMKIVILTRDPFRDRRE